MPQNGVGHQPQQVFVLAWQTQGDSLVFVS